MSPDITDEQRCITDRGTSARSLVIAQAPANGGNLPTRSAAERSLKVRGLEPFRFEHAGVTIRGVISTDANSFLDTDAGPSPSISPFERPALRQRPSDQILSEIVTAVMTGNRFITKDSARVKNVLIHPNFSSCFILLDGEPIVELVAQQGDVSAPSMTHEMGHAIFNDWRDSRRDVARVICYIFLTVTAGASASQFATLPGIRMVTQPEWNANSNIIDHPQGNVDEFWASSLTAFLVNRNGLKNSIDRATKADPVRVTKPGQNLLTLLTAVEAQALKSVSFSKPILDLIAESNNPKADSLLSSTGGPGHRERNDSHDDTIRLLLAL